MARRRIIPLHDADHHRPLGRGFAIGNTLGLGIGGYEDFVTVQLGDGIDQLPGTGAEPSSDFHALCVDRQGMQAITTQVSQERAVFASDAQVNLVDLHRSTSHWTAVGKGINQQLIGGLPRHRGHASPQQKSQ